MVNDTLMSDENGLFNWTIAVTSSISSMDAFCHSHPNISLRTIDVWEMSRWNFVIISIAFFIAGTLGNALLIGVIHYERFGGDPQKRSIRNRLTSEIVFCAACISNMCIVMFLGDLVLSFDSSVKLNDFCVRLQRQEKFMFSNI